MRRMRWARNIYNVLIWGAIVFLTSQIVFKSIALSRGTKIEEAWNGFVKEESLKIGQFLIKTTSPAVTYMESPSQQMSLEEMIISIMEGTLPVQNVFREQNAYAEAAKEHYLMDNPENNSIIWETDLGEVGTEAASEESAPALPINETESAELPVSVSIDESIWNPVPAGLNYSLAKLDDYDFLVKNFYAISEITTLTSAELSASKLLSMDFTLPAESGGPQILIYHTHSQESYLSEDGGEGDTIVEVGEYLANVLTEQFGYEVYHDTSTYDVMGGALDRNKAYTYAEEGVVKILNQYPQIQVVIDLHRDGVAETTHLVTEINQKPTAMIMFVNGISRTTWQGDIDYLNNPYIESNLALSLQMELKAAEYYPTYARRIMINAYRYNQHLSSRSLLVEVGAQNNTDQEAYNAMEPFAVILDKVLQGKD